MSYINTYENKNKLHLNHLTVVASYQIIKSKYSEFVSMPDDLKLNTLTIRLFLH